ncbi:hypothetical protein EsH8_VII_000611 [Colletotrichum jinshuiense]
MQPQDPRSTGIATGAMLHDAMQLREMRQDDETVDQQPQRVQGLPKPVKDNTLGSTTASSAQGPASSSKPWSLKQFWNEHVSVVVDFETCRDHLALERTFLAYLRTGVVTAILGAAVAQLFALQTPDTGFGYTAVGKPLATVCYCFSICITLLGACRAWRLQHALLLGKTFSGGFEIMTLAMGLLALIVVFFGILIALDVAKESAGR